MYEEFLKELEELSRKYKVAIGGCGCCGSPYLSDLSEEELQGQFGYVLSDKLDWVDKPKEAERQRKIREQWEKRNPLPPVLEQTLDDYTCRYCSSQSEFFNDEERICSNCLHNAINALREKGDHVGVDKYCDQWRKIADWRATKGRAE